MNSVAEIDKAGRFVVPKQMRDALHLVPGTRITLEQDGEAIVIRPEQRSGQLVKKRGFWVYDAGAPVAFDGVEAIAQDRAIRMQHVMGLNDDVIEA